MESKVTEQRKQKTKDFSTTIEKIARKRLKDKNEERKRKEEKEKYEREKPILTQLQRKSLSAKKIQDEQGRKAENATMVTTTTTGLPALPR